MRVELNLASQSFGNRRPFWLASGLAGLLLGAIAVLLVVEYSRSHEVSPAFLRRQAELRAELSRLTSADSQARGTLQDPANAPVLERSLFLNEMLLRKGISWTRTFADLERILPPRVLMMSIRPEVTLDNKVRLEMQVGAESGRDFVEFLNALESSDLFGPATMGGYSPPSENQPLYRYQLTVNYEQQL
jgi:type IV pilus assembly protein PilN